VSSRPTGSWSSWRMEMHPYGSSSVVVDHFVYRPAGPCRPPSLALLPIPQFPTKSESVPASSFNPLVRRPRLDSRGTGLLRRGNN
jgi:hypothetical protein